MPEFKLVRANLVCGFKRSDFLFVFKSTPASSGRLHFTSEKHTHTQTHIRYISIRTQSTHTNTLRRSYRAGLVDSHNKYFTLSFIPTEVLRKNINLWLKAHVGLRARVCRRPVCMCVYVCESFSSSKLNISICKSICICIKEIMYSAEHFTDKVEMKMVLVTFHKLPNACENMCV